MTSGVAVAAITVPRTPFGKAGNPSIMRIIALIIALSIGGIIPAAPAQRIMIDWGGQLGVYIDRYNEWRRTGELVVVDGFCISACTMVTGLIKPERLCATPFARLAFHSAAFIDIAGTRTFAREATRIVWHIYPQRLRELLLRHGWQDGMDHANLIYVEGAELHTIIRPCTPADMLELNGIPGVNE